MFICLRHHTEPLHFSFPLKGVLGSTRLTWIQILADCVTLTQVTSPPVTSLPLAELGGWGEATSVAVAMSCCRFIHFASLNVKHWRLVMKSITYKLGIFIYLNALILFLWCREEGLLQATQLQNRDFFPAASFLLREGKDLSIYLWWFGVLSVPLLNIGWLIVAWN